MNNFDRRQLRYFVAVAEDLHFGRAAQRLHLSQPSLSQQIVALEDDLGLKLFERSRRKVELTVAGQQFLTDAKNILADMDKAAARAQAADEGRTGALHIGMNYSSPFHLIPTQTFRRFAENYPNIRLELYQEPGVKQLDRLRQHTLDVCFVWPTREDFSDDVTFLPLDKDEMKLVVGDKNPVANKAHIAVRDLAEQRLFLMPWQTRTDFYRALVNAYAAEGMGIDLRTDIIQMPFVMSIVAANQGITFVPSFLEHIRPEGTTFRPFNFLTRKERMMPLCVAFRTGDALPAVKNFIADATAVVAAANTRSPHAER